MASPQATGSAALLLSAAKQKRIDLTPAKLRTALTSTAQHVKGLQAYEEGAGSIDLEEAWDSIRDGATAHEYSVKAPVDTAIEQFLKTPGFGTGVYDREGGLKAGQKKTYDVTITRTSGPDRAIRHELDLANNTDGAFRIVGEGKVQLSLNKPMARRGRPRACTRACPRGRPKPRPPGRPPNPRPPLPRRVSPRLTASPWLPASPRSGPVAPSARRRRWLPRPARP
ncbi:hypothetical protein SHIRM173S_07817 [Streptomyces hirsutus]